MRDGGKYRNSALVVGPKGPIATFAKMWLPNGNEREFFTAGDELMVIKSQGWAFTVGICADLDRGEYFATAAKAGAELFLLPVAGSGLAKLVGPDGNQARQAEAHRKLHEKIMRAWARRDAMFICYANQAGRSGNSWFPALAMAVDPEGELLGLHEATEGMLVVDASRDILRNARAAAVPPPEPIEIKNSAGHIIRVRHFSDL